MVEEVVLDHGLAYRRELGLSPAIEGWSSERVLVNVLADRFGPLERGTWMQLTTVRGFVPSALQLVSPIAVTPSSFREFHEAEKRTPRSLQAAAETRCELAAHAALERRRMTQRNRARGPRVNQRLVWASAGMCAPFLQPVHWSRAPIRCSPICASRWNPRGRPLAGRSHEMIPVPRFVMGPGRAQLRFFSIPADSALRAREFQWQAGSEWSLMTSSAPRTGTRFGFSRRAQCCSDCTERPMLVGIGGNLDPFQRGMTRGPGTAAQSTTASAVVSTYLRGTAPNGSGAGRQP
ncbi:MAG: hypothetical protein IT458_14715 [Planctomycetes bacterium]|nr:hypothetical protein [Planctomycetota bacterium]